MECDKFCQRNSGIFLWLFSLFFVCPRRLLLSIVKKRIFVSKWKPEQIQSNNRLANFNMVLLWWDCKQKWEKKIKQLFTYVTFLISLSVTHRSDFVNGRICSISYDRNRFHRSANRNSAKNKFVECNDIVFFYIDFFLIVLINSGDGFFLLFLINSTLLNFFLYPHIIVPMNEWIENQTKDRGIQTQKRKKVND